MFILSGDIQDENRIHAIQGYIFKEYLYNGEIVDHRKTVNSLTDEKVKVIADFINSQDIEYKKCDFKTFNKTDISNFIKEVHNDMEEITKNKELFDYKLSKIIV